MWARRLGSCLVLQIPAPIIIQLDMVNSLLMFLDSWNVASLQQCMDLSWLFRLCLVQNGGLGYTRRHESPTAIFKLEDLKSFHETFPVSETHNAGARSVGQEESFWPSTCWRASNKACWRLEDLKIFFIDYYLPMEIIKEGNCEANLRKYQSLCHILIAFVAAYLNWWSLWKLMMKT